MTPLVLKRPKLSKTPNVLRYDPSKTGPLRREFIRQIESKFKELKRRINHIVVTEDYFGLNKPKPIENAGWQFNSNFEQIAKFQEWLQHQMTELFYPAQENSWWYEYIKRGWQGGQAKVMAAWKNPTEFLKTAFNNPVRVERVKVLAARVFTELKNMTTDSATRLTRVLIDGLIGGKSPYDVAKDMTEEIDGMPKTRAITIARSEIVRANAEGQLDTLEGMGLAEVSVAVEWSTSGVGVTRKGNPSPCAICAPMRGVVFSLEEAHGMIPAHPNCMCSFIPANVGEDGKGQVRSFVAISKAMQKSLKARIPKSSKRTIAQQAKKVGWNFKKISKKRPKSIIPPE